MGFVGFIGTLLKYTVFFSVLVIIALTFYYYFSGSGYLPYGYYQTAKKMYGDIGVHDISNLTYVLNRAYLPPYKEDVFDSTESSAYLEWYLEGHGFKAYMARSDAISHLWVIVELDNGERVAIEPTALTSNKYNPPGIIDAPDGRYRNYSITWKEYINKNPGKPYEEFLKQYSYYYNPPKLFDNPGQIVGIASTLKYPGWAKMDISEFDWWNSEPFNSTYPFSEWN